MPRRRFGRRAAFAVVGAVVPMCCATLPAAAGTEHTVHVGDRAEAWYANGPLNPCTTPLGCPPSGAPTSPYPAGTLHVGVAGGQETARTYLTPDLSTLPAGATADTGTMTLPVDVDAQSGTRAPEAAAIEACLATQPAPDGAAGAQGPIPGVDCAVRASARYDAGRGVFTVDLATFLAAWASGRAQDGIALLPDPSGAQPTDAWHVAFNGRDRAGVPHIASTVGYRPAPAQTATAVSTGTSAAGAATAPVAPPPPATGATPALPAPVTAASPPVAPAPQVAPPRPPATAAQPVAFTTGFAYPMAFLTPLVLLAGAVFLVRLFTRDATPLGLRS